jgi:hypothetical protein
VRIASALAMLVVAEVLFRYARRRALTQASIERLAWGAWWVTRPGLALFVFLILELPVRTDVAQHYLPQAHAALAGGLVYRDFLSSYGPLFPYLAAAVIALGTSPLMLVAAAIAAEAIALRLWLRAAPPNTLEPSAQAACSYGALAYLCTPFVVWDVALAGHNQAWLSAGVALCVWLGQRGRWLWAGLALALAAAAVKLLALVVAPALLAHAGRPARFALGLGLGLFALHAPFVWLGADVLQPLETQSAYWTSGNLPFVLAGVWPGVLAATTGERGVALLGAALFGLALAARRRAGAAQASSSALEASLCLGCTAFLLLSSKAYAHYAVITWLPACFVLARAGLGPLQRMLLYLLGLLATVEPALWFHALDQRTLPEALAGAFSIATVSVFVAVELALLAGYAWLLRAAWQGLVPSKPP